MYAMGAMVLVMALAPTGLAFGEEESMLVSEALRSDEARVRDAAVDHVLKERQSLIEQLIAQFDPASVAQYSDETRCAAAYLLGELRAVEAAPILAKSLANPPGPRVRTDKSRYDHPVHEALLKIGRQAVPALIENIEQTDDVRLRRSSLGMLSHILGGKRRLLELLTKLEVRTTDATVGERVREARAWADSHFIEDEEPLY
jgi:hypothetical protein